MGRRIKTSLVILIHSIILTAVLLLGIFLYLAVSQPTLPTTQSGVALFQSSSQLSTTTSTNGTVTVPISQAIPVTDLNSYYQIQFVRYLPISILILILIVFSLSFAMWNIIRSIEARQTLIVSQTVKAATDQHNNKAHQLHYERLNSYISHEQKNALSLLRARLELKGDSELVKSITTVSDHIDDILTLNTNEDTLYAVDAAIVCAEVLDEYTKIYSNIAFEFQEDEDLIILAKEIWLYRAVSNLVDNAIKYGEQGDITVRIKKEKGSVIITIQDNGIGIDQHLLNRIFDDRFRINKLNKDGYGIGLSLVRHVCNLCSGIYYVESAPGAGTTFFLVFPAA